MKEPPLHRLIEQTLKLAVREGIIKEKKPMKQVIKNLFSPLTPQGRIFRGALQTFIGLSAAFIAVLGVPEVQAWFATLPLIVQIGGLTVAVASVTAVHNYAKKLWEVVKE